MRVSTTGPPTVRTRWTDIVRISTLTIIAGVLGCQRGPTAADGGALHQRWLAGQVGYSESRPAITSSSVLFATGNGHVVARDPATGTARWDTQIAFEQVSGYNLLARSGVVVAPIAYSTVGLDAASGTILWRYAAPLDTLQDPAHPTPGYVVGTRIDADASTVYLGAWGASVSALDLRTGAVRWIWRVDPSVAFRTGVVGTRVSGDTVFAAAWHFLDARGLKSEPWIIALDRLTGRELWRIALPNFPSGGVAANGAPGFVGNLVVLGARGGETWAVDRTTHQIAWEFRPQTKLATVAEAEVYGSNVYVDGGDGNIYSLRAADGTLAWKAPFAGSTVVDLLVTERRVYAENGPTVFVFDRLSGDLVAQQNVPGLNGPGGGSTFGSAAAFDQGAVFITVAGGAWSFDEP